ncbi:4Fe-4S dicluster domain-containing protein [Saccharopolyspora sp. NPDC002686]|uniref:4Fe-4S dicluster domain-containing protein n=1 Tax=Saccharopolyspora sp. NPDC002686 TaxID=3154541 RepID=UPI00331A2233
MRRKLLHAAHVVTELLQPLGRRLVPHRAKFWVVPMLPIRWMGRLRSPARPWRSPVAPAPDELRTVAGVRLDHAAQEAVARTAPLHNFFQLHPEAWIPMSSMWSSIISCAPRVQRAARARTQQRTAPTAAPTPLSPAELTARLKAEAQRIGLSAVGVAPHQPKYTYAESQGLAVGDRVVVGILEQNYSSTQLIPSLTSERAALSTYAELEDRMAALVEWLREHGYRARAEGYAGESMVIPYAVEAGLGQLGLNGQLLTPYAGSRCRIEVLTTDAPLEFDQPVDYGIEGVCDRCQICVRRCPAGAIPATRKEHRGVVKAKLNTKRCLPVVGQAAGCSVCMKVCPVQRYGLSDVLDEFARSGRILGKDTDELEGYDWPIDGEHYGPGATPRVSIEFMQPRGFAFDPDRRSPPGQHASRPDSGDTAHP